MSAGRALTPKQVRLRREIERLVELNDLDPSKVGDLPPDWRTPSLQLKKDKLIRGGIVFSYVLMDEHLSDLICWYFFGTRRSFPALWRTKRFRRFNHFVLDRLYLIQKLGLADAARPIPRKFKGDLAALNELRNGVAHSLFAVNRRQRPKWKGNSILSRVGFELFERDVALLQHLHEDVF